MTPDKLLVAVFSIGGIAFTYWFFLMKKDEKAVVVSHNNIDVEVEGGFTPSVISIPINQTTTLNFTRHDPSSCLEEVVLPDFKIRVYLPLNEKTAISLTPKKEGKYEISCGMNMFHGKIIVN
jgi:plastocyanin domain-containing protein